MEKFGCILQAPGGAFFLDVFFFQPVCNGIVWDFGLGIGWILGLEDKSRVETSSIEMLRNHTVAEVAETRMVFLFEIHPFLTMLFEIIEQRIPV